MIDAVGGRRVEGWRIRSGVAGKKKDALSKTHRDNSISLSREGMDAI